MTSTPFGGVKKNSLSGTSVFSRRFAKVKADFPPSASSDSNVIIRNDLGSTPMVRLVKSASFLMGVSWSRHSVAD